MKRSVKFIHARTCTSYNNDKNSNIQTFISIDFQTRLNARTLAVAALAGATVVEYYEHRTGTKAKRKWKPVPLRRLRLSALSNRIGQLPTAALDTCDRFNYLGILASIVLTASVVIIRTLTCVIHGLCD
ncbi:unnamed protein product [Ilex paraguariensis]|uniref:Uncharacterized protein n=1 Tax=Ilex paraguariensis TaxID=185542 RepID=A0ABC8RUB6_9AQUA